MHRLASLLARMDARTSRPAIASGEHIHAYSELASARRDWRDRLAARQVEPGAVVALKADFSFEAIALFLALLENQNIAVLIPPGAQDVAALLADTKAAWLANFSNDTDVEIEPAEGGTPHPLVRTLRNRDESGFVIFSSGSTGRPKAVLHGVEGFLAKFERANKSLSTLAFLLFDHIAGLDTLFYAFASGSLLVFTQKRETHHVCRLIARYRVEVLPTSPSFLRLLCLSDALQTCDLSSLKIITYGAEPMDQSTLDRVRQAFPGVRLIQKYGMSELGSPPSRSREDGSLWLKMGGDGFETRVIDGILWIKAEGAMLGYLNAPNPFDDDGWLCTGDAVEIDGEWMRIIGRSSELIIVGGEKVYPQEVESFILQIEGVRDAVVRGIPHAMLGQIVTAEIEWDGGIEEKELTRQVRRFCRGKLAPHKIPMTVTKARGPLSTLRQKKIRVASDSNAFR